MRKQFFLFARTSSLKQAETGARELRRSPSTFDSLLSRASLSLLPSQRPATLPTPPYFASPAPFSAFPSSSTSSTSSPGRILARRRCQTLAQASLLPSPFEERALALPFFLFGPLPLLPFYCRTAYDSSSTGIGSIPCALLFRPEHR